MYFTNGFCLNPALTSNDANLLQDQLLMSDKEWLIDADPISV